jgi:hypothetical protein
VSDYENAATLGQAIEDTAEDARESFRVCRDQLGVGLAKSIERTAACLLVGGAPAILYLRA